MILMILVDAKSNFVTFIRLMLAGQVLFSYLRAKMRDLVLVVGTIPCLRSRAMLLLVLAIRRNWRQFS